MTDRRGFAEWEGQPVMVDHLGMRIEPGHEYSSDHGILEEVNEWGLVFNHPRYIPALDAVGEERSAGGWRTVSEFLPWHRIISVRPMEPEEREARGL